MASTTTSTSNNGDSSSTRENALSILNHMFIRMSKWPMDTDLHTYTPLPTDVIVSTFPKSGTTLIQYLAYQTLVAANQIPLTAFQEINQVAPWVDWYQQMETPLSKHHPRIFKSHSPRHAFIDAGKTIQKHIVVIRDPLSLPYSWLDFLYEPLTSDYHDTSVDLNDVNIKQDVFYLYSRHRLLTLPLNPESTKQFSEDDLLTHTSKYGWFSHSKEWLLPTIPSNSLILFYEDIVKDLEQTVKRVAHFMDVQITAQGIKFAAEKCTREAMAGDPRFDCHSEARLFGYRYGVSKARHDRLDGFKVVKMDQSIVDAVNQKMNDVFGVSNYNDFKQMINQRQMEMNGR